MAILSYEREPARQVVEGAPPRDVVHQHRPDRPLEKRLLDGLEGKLSGRVPNLGTVLLPSRMSFDAVTKKLGNKRHKYVSVIIE